MNYTSTRLLALSLLFACSFSLLISHEKDSSKSNSSDLLFAQSLDGTYLGKIFEHQSGGGGQQRLIKDGIGVAGNPRLKIINMGPSINSKSDDYAPTVTADGRTFYFVSNRPGSKLLPNGRPSADF
jgi:hypothetical protein